GRGGRGGNGVNGAMPQGCPAPRGPGRAFFRAVDGRAVPGGPAPAPPGGARVPEAGFRRDRGPAAPGRTHVSAAFALSPVVHRVAVHRVAVHRPRNRGGRSGRRRAAWGHGLLPALPRPAAPLRPPLRTPGRPA